MYSEEDYLMLSGIQHFYFCKRQWALIHIEQLWNDNDRTIMGNILHERADKPFIKENRKDFFITRAVPVSSKKLGLSGILDVVEFEKNDDGISISNKKGKWLPKVIEYKKGKPKKDDRDIVQLVAQCMCLEEKYDLTINVGYLYYFDVNKRLKIEISTELRELVCRLSAEMHFIYEQCYTPKAEIHKNCRLCSLVDICLPRITKKKRSIENYIYKDMEV